jgi:hypothetical protein
MVHLFYLDERVTETKSGRSVSRTLRDYRLLFCGEIVAQSMQQTPQSRGLVLQCIDFSSYWDSAHLTAIEYGPGGNWATHSAALSGSNAGLVDDIVNQMPEKLVQWLRQTPRTPGLATVDGLAGGIIRMLEAIGGVPGHERGVNDFFTVAELRCKLLQQITAEEDDNTAYRLLKGKVFDEWVRSGLSNMGQQVTFRDVMKLLFQYIYYEVVPNPAAKYSPAVGEGGSKTNTGTSSLLKTSEGGSAKVTISGVIQDMGLFVGTTEASGDWKNYLSAFSSLIAGAKKKLSKLTSGEIGKEARQVTSFLDAASQKLDATMKGIKPGMSVAGLPETGQSLDAELKAILEPLKSALELITKSQDHAYSVTYSTARTERLGSQIIRPDCWFAPPPVCNVVFPEQYTQLQYDRNFLGEVTRTLVWMSNTLVGPDKLLADKVLAPNPTSFKDTGLMGVKGSLGYRELMPHEYHTGIVPREEWLPNTAATSAEGQRPATEAAGYGDVLSWGQRTALYLFYKYRFAQRSASLGGRFNPGLVCGFPALVIRGPYSPPAMNLTEALDNADALGAPVHLLGMIGTLSHSVGQDGGTSSFSLHHVRHHNGSDDEYLNLIRGLRTTSHTYEEDLSLAKINAMPAGADKKKRLDFLVGCTTQGNTPPPPPVAKADAKGGNLVEVEESDDQIPPDGTTKSGRVYIPTNCRIKRGMPGLYGKGKVASIIVVKPTRSKVDGGLAFDQVKVSWVQDQELPVAQPIELILRPRSWFSPKYSNELVGQEIYQPFFGCNSIIDEFKATVGDTSSSPDAPAAVEEDGKYKLDSSTTTVESAELNYADKMKHSVERSANALAYLYGKVKELRGDVEDFIQQYTYRPIATKEEILGSDDLEFDVFTNGSVEAKTVQAPGGVGPPYVPTVGFHSTAVHQQIVESKVPLAGLVKDYATKLTRINSTGQPTEIQAKYDVRQDKRGRVMDYYTSLSKRGLRG